MSPIAVVVYYIAIWLAGVAGIHILGWSAYKYIDANISMYFIATICLLIAPYIYVLISNPIWLWKNIKSMRYIIVLPIYTPLLLFFIRSVILISAPNFYHTIIDFLFELWAIPHPAVLWLMPTLLWAILFIYTNTKLLKNNN